jgi:hypothetical protein
MQLMGVQQNSRSSVAQGSTINKRCRERKKGGVEGRRRVRGRKREVEEKGTSHEGIESPVPNAVE